MEFKNLQSKSNEASNSEAIWITLQAKPDSKHASYLPPIGFHPGYARLARQPEWQAAMKSTHKAIVIHMVSAQASCGSEQRVLNI